MGTHKRLALVFGLVMLFGVDLSWAEPIALVTPSAITQTAGNAGPSITNLINDSGL